MIVMTEEIDRDRIEADAAHKANTEARISALEQKVVLILKGLGIAATAIGMSIWNTISGGIFK